MKLRRKVFIPILIAALTTAAMAGPFTSTASADITRLSVGPQGMVLRPGVQFTLSMNWNTTFFTGKIPTCF